MHIMNVARLAITLLISSLIVVSVASYSAILNVPSKRAVIHGSVQMVSIKLMYANKAEPLDNVLKRFRREVNKSGHLYVGRHQRFWESEADKRKRKDERLRFKKKMLRQQMMMRRKYAGVSTFDDRFPER